MSRCQQRILDRAAHYVWLVLVAAWLTTAFIEHAVKCRHCVRTRK